MVPPEQAAEARPARLSDPGRSGDPPPPGPRPSDTFPGALPDLLVRHRLILFGFVGLLFLAAFNGQWKIGRDGAMYRGLAHSLAAGQGWHYTDFAESTIYPGYPLLLAGIEIVFGPGDLVPHLVMNAMALLALVFVYKLVALHYEGWIAILVTCFVGINPSLIKLANDLMTDVPFFLATVVTLYGWERARLATSRRDNVIAAACLIPGLAAAAALRPTYWVLALGLGLVCTWMLIRGPRRGLAIAGLALIAVVSMSFFLLDPRTDGFHPLGGGYEHQLVAHLGDVATSVGINLWKLLSREVATAMFGGRFSPVLTPVLTLLGVGASLMLWRRQPLWTLLILITVAITMLLTTVPRYYLMVLQLMLLSWLLLLLDVGGRMRVKPGQLLLTAGLLLVLIPSLIRTGREIADQRYRDVGHREQWAGELRMAERIAQLVPAGERVLGPDSAPVLSYFSGRHVMMHQEVLPLHKGKLHYPRHMAALGIRYAIFPQSNYSGGARVIREMVDKGVIVPVRTVVRAGGLVLAEVRFDVPEGDWRLAPTTNTAARVLKRPTPQQKAARAERHAAADAREARLARERREAREARQARQERLERQERAERKARAERRAAKERKEARERREREAREQARPASSASSASDVAAAPTTHPVRRRPSLADPATRPTTAPAPAPAPPGTVLLPHQPTGPPRM